MKNNKGIVFKRQQLILQHLNESKTVKIDDLAKILSVSPITIRRDLQNFEEKGIVERFYGGATLVEGSLREDTDLSDSSEKHNLQKHAIAKYAASLIENGDTIFINSSSTALLVIEYIQDKRVIVVTNNGKALQVTKSASVELVLTGGEINERKQSMVGEYATHILSKIIADKCILGVSGISANSGISTSVLQETAVNEMMLKRCKGPKIILATSSKVGKEHNFLSGGINHVSCLITDSAADSNQVSLLRDKGVEVIIADPINQID